jgi:hypothetical protein
LRLSIITVTECAALPWEDQVGVVFEHQS